MALLDAFRTGSFIHLHLRFRSHSIVSLTSVVQDSFVRPPDLWNSDPLLILVWSFILSTPFSFRSAALACFSEISRYLASYWNSRGANIAERLTCAMFIWTAKRLGGTMQCDAVKPT